MSILDLSYGAKILEFWATKDDAGDGELDPILDELLAELEGKIEDKVEAYCRIIRELELTAAARKEEAERIRKLSDQDGNTVKAMKGRLMYFFGLQSIDKLKTPNFNLSICNNGGVQPLEVTVPAEHLPTDCQKITLSPNLDVIREKIKGGEIVAGVTVLPRGQHLRIK
ncbi:Siphovirus Gp157 [uncultured Caudovirales phage]|uniref:Siphovirus Gp157 n=1 Tax=uncultured Caudovirales phage TaxID=2100421 RepID=A0A6J5P741_9CAUD|nr:Siphovirus Gp157 [uncultured Caudovirales phage]